jgi:hypothetical protein
MPLSTCRRGCGSSHPPHSGTTSQAHTPAAAQAACLASHRACPPCPVPTATCHGAPGLLGPQSRARAAASNWTAGRGPWGLDTTPGSGPNNTTSRLPERAGAPGRRPGGLRGRNPGVTSYHSCKSRGGTSGPSLGRSAGVRGCTIGANLLVEKCLSDPYAAGESVLRHC